MSLDEGVPIKCVYGFIEDVFNTDVQEDEFYVVRVVREGTLQIVDSNYPMIPMEQTPEELASLYGPPSALVGKRVRIDYTGRDFTSGVARIVSDRMPAGGNQLNTVRSRGFRYAAPGGSGGFGS